MAEGRFTVVVTCHQCDLPVHLTLPSTPSTPTYGEYKAHVRLNQEKLAQAVRAHVENCGDTP